MKLLILKRQCNLVLLLPLLVFNATGYSQGKSLVKSQNDCMLQKNEKVFVQLEKQVYISGEYLNYKAYVVNNPGIRQALKSKVIYFEIVKSNNVTVFNWRNNASNGKVSGSISLPDSISCGIYTLRAFTNWMQNNPSSCYSTNILITKIGEKDIPNKLTYMTEDDSSTEIGFFPEGGNLIENIENHIGYKINTLDTSSKPLACSIKDNGNNVITSFTTNASGYGSFVLTPATGKTYKAEYTGTNGDQKKIPLPTALKFGYSLHSEILQKNINLSIRTNITGYPGSNSIRLNIFSLGKMIVDTALNLTDGSGSFLIPRGRMAEGVSEVILLGQTKNKLAQRLIYLPPNHLPTIKINSQKRDYAKGEKIKLEIETQNLSDNDSTELSVSVTTKQPFQQVGNNQAIAPYLIFNSEISNATDLFDISDSLSTKKANDILLAAKDHYTWNKDSTAPLSHLKESYGYVLSGKLISRSTKNPIQGALVTLACIDSFASLKYYYTDVYGNFFFHLDTTYDNKGLIVQLSGNDDKNEDVIWEFDKKHKDQKNLDNTVINPGQDSKEYLVNCRNTRLINIIYKDTTANGKLTGLLPDTRTNFYGVPDKIIYPEEFLELPDFKDIVDNLLPGIRFRKKAGVYSLLAIDLTIRDYFQKDALLLLNGVPFNDLQYISTLGSKQIKRIDLVQSEIMYGKLTFYGLISVYTFDGKVPISGKGNSYLLKNNVGPLLNLKNSSKLTSENNSNIPDLRQTLYWNPTLVIKGNKKATIEFNASDLNSIYNINIQGITSTGLPMGATHIIEVK
jgi:hypothetical protein